MNATTIAGCWHTFHNLSGYMPESDVICDATRADAVITLTAEMERYADEDDEGTFADVDPSAYASEEAYWASDDAPSMRATIDAILQDDGPNTMPGSSWGCWAIDGRGRTIHFGLAFVPSGDCDHDGRPLLAPASARHGRLATVPGHSARQPHQGRITRCSPTMSSRTWLTAQ